LKDASRKKAAWGTDENDIYGFGNGPVDGGGSSFSRATEFGQEKPTGRAIGGWRPEGGGEEAEDAKVEKVSGPSREELAKQREVTLSATLYRFLT